MASEESFYIGKTMLYKIMETVTEIDEASIDGRINIARLLYTLARLQPKDKDKELLERKLIIYDTFVQSMHRWVIEESQRKQLLTALHLAIYYLRDRDVVS